MAAAREQAISASRGCPECGGYGMTSRMIPVEGGELSVGCICHRCDLGSHYHERRQLGEQGFRRLLPLADLPHIADGIWQYPEATRIWLAQDDGYCVPQPLRSHEAAQYWRQLRARLATAHDTTRSTHEVT